MQPGLALTARKRSLGNRLRKRVAKANKMPRAGTYWGEIPARGDVRIPKEKGYPAGAQNSIAISGAIFSLICNLNKDQFMALLLQALFFY